MNYTLNYEEPLFVSLVEWEREGEEASPAAQAVTLVVTLVTLVLRLFFVRRNALNVGISSKTICCYACYASFL